MKATKPKYTLDNVEDRHKENPDTFHIPTRGERELLKVGDFVKMIFLGSDRGERMWVVITKGLADGKYKGELRNHPFVLEGRLKWGDEMEFGPENIASFNLPEEA